MMVRSEVMRGRLETVYYAASFVANEKTAVNIKLQDVCIPLRKGTKFNQIQSTWFPLIDLNPQTFVEYILLSQEDFKKQTHRL
jgi:predicted acyl esterase